MEHVEPMTTVKEVLDFFKQFSDDTKLCPYCFTVMTQEENDGKTVWICTNTMCMNEHKYE